MEKKRDFYSYGKYIAAEGIVSFVSLAKQVEEKYGKEARAAFELGIASSIPRFGEESYVENAKELLNRDGTVGGITGFGSPELRNNSYFGGLGVSKIYDENGCYNEPFQKKKKNNSTKKHQ